MTFPSIPSILMIPLFLVASFLVGGAYARIAGFFRAKWNVNEVVLTIMMNYGFDFVKLPSVGSAWN